MTAALRAALALVALANAITGVQAVAAPRAFYDGFPFGRGWVAELPPFNAHLTTDVGGFFLAFAVLFGWAAVRLEPSWTDVKSGRLTNAKRPFSQSRAKSVTSSPVRTSSGKPASLPAPSPSCPVSATSAAPWWSTRKST